MAQTVLGRHRKYWLPSNHGFHKRTGAHDWQDRVTAKRRTLVQSGFCLLALLLHSQLHPHRSSAGLLPSTTLCMSFLPKMALPYSVHLEFGHHTAGKSFVHTSRDVIHRTLHLPLIVFAIRLGTPLGAVLPLLVMLGMVPGTSRGFKQCLSLNCVKGEAESIRQSLLIKTSI